MSCEAWEELVALGEAVLVEDSPERRRAEMHLESCPVCEERAFLLDPSWAVRRSPGMDVTADEVAELKQRLVKAGRMREIERSVGFSRRRALAAAVVVLVALAAIAGMISMGPTSSARTNLVETAYPTRPGGLTLAGDETGEPAERLGLSVSAIGSVTPAAARVYEIGDEDFALVMVVHETLDL